MSKKHIKANNKKYFMSKKQERQLYKDLMWGRAMRIIRTGKFIPVDEAIARIEAGQ